MPPLSKKPIDKLAVSTSPAWHPDFRISGQLPDIKAVRTTFFVNGLAVFIAFALIVYTAYREHHLFNLRADTEHAQRVVEARKPVSDRAVSLYKNFEAEERKILDLQEFLSPSRYSLSELVLEVGQTLPSVINLYNIHCTPFQLTLRGAIKGSPEEASGRAVAYVEELRKNKKISKLFPVITLTNMNRNPGTGLIQFAIELKTTDSPKNISGGKK